MLMKKTRIAEIHEESTPLGGLARTLINQPDLRLVVLRVPAGEQVGEHIAPVEVVFVALGGSGTIYAGGEAIIIEAGEMASCPAGYPRTIRAGDGDLELLVIRAPNP